MKLDIPQEHPLHRNPASAAPDPADTRIPKHCVPDSPILHRLKPVDESSADPLKHYSPIARKHPELTPELPRERRRPVASEDPRRPVRPSGRIAGLELRPEEKQLLREAGRFRVIRTADLREFLYNGRARPLENDLKYLLGKSLIETRHINLRRDGRRRTIERVEVVILTKNGRRLITKDGDLPRDQRVYAGLVKPREAEHDSQIYRAYRKESERIERIGGTNLRVRLDFELKADVQKAIYAARRSDPERDRAEIKEEVAARHELPFVNGKIQIPDARIEYDLPRDPPHDVDQGPRSGHQDIEVLTAAYHTGHLRSKAQAGFRNYASAADRTSLTAKIEDDHHLMENILDL